MPTAARWLGYTFVGNAVWQWMAAAGVAAVLLVAFHLFRGLIVTRLVRWAGRSQNRLDDVITSPTKATRPWLAAILACIAGSHALDLPPVARRVLDVVLMVALTAQIGLWGQAISRAALDAWAKKEGRAGSATVAEGLGFAIRVVVWALLILLVLANLGVRIDALVAGLGIGGVAAALAVQNVLGDVFASLALYFDRPFDLGDFVVIGDVQGTVQKIGVRSTRLLSISGEQVIFPNAKLAGNTIRNFRRMEERRVVLQLGIASETPADKIERAVEILRESIAAEEGVRFDRAHFKGFGTAWLDLETVYVVGSREQSVMMDRQQAINLRILRAFVAEGIEMAGPSLLVRVDAAPAPSAVAVKPPVG